MLSHRCPSMYRYFANQCLLPGLYVQAPNLRFALETTSLCMFHLRVDQIPPCPNMRLTHCQPQHMNDTHLHLYWMCNLHLKIHCCSQRNILVLHLNKRFGRLMAGRCLAGRCSGRTGRWSGRSVLTQRQCRMPGRWMAGRYQRRRRPGMPVPRWRRSGPLRPRSMRIG